MNDNWLSGSAFGGLVQALILRPYRVSVATPNCKGINNHLQPIYYKHFYYKFKITWFYDTPLSFLLTQIYFHWLKWKKKKKNWFSMTPIHPNPPRINKGTCCELEITCFLSISKVEHDCLHSDMYGHKCKLFATAIVIDLNERQHQGHDRMEFNNHCTYSQKSFTLCSWYSCIGHQWCSGKNTYSVSLQRSSTKISIR